MGKKKPLTEDQLEKKKKANQKYYQQKQATMTPEEKKEQLKRKRKVSRESYHRKRAAMTSEEKDAVREKQRVSRNKRKSTSTEEQKEKKRKEGLEYYYQNQDLINRKRREKRKRAVMTPEKIDAINAKARETYKERRKLMTEQEKSALRKRNGNAKARYLAKQTPAQKKARNQRNVARQRQKRQALLGKEYYDYLAKRRNAARIWRLQLKGAKLQRYRESDRRRGQKYKGLRLKVRVNCPHCFYELQRGSIKGHIKRLHAFCNFRMMPLTREEREEIKTKTCESTLASNWREFRRGRITASKAHCIVRRVSANPSKIVESMMSNSGGRKGTQAMERGVQLEPVAVSKFMELQKISRNEYEYPVGFCVHPHYSFIGATPDALIGNNECVEIKCPVHPVIEVAARKYSYVVKAKKGEKGGSFIHGGQPKKGHFKMNRKHAYYTQVVLEMMCTGRDQGHFVLYYQEDENPSNWEMWVETITKEEATADWNQRIKPKLLAFYTKYLASEPIPTGK